MQSSERGIMENIMTDRQMKFITKLILDKFKNCSNMEEVEKAIEEVTEMVNEEKQDNKKQK